MTVSLDLLRTFLAVHRAGSITAAAAVLGLAQPTVTAQVRSLEAVIGRALFDRLPRGVAPTAAADDLARRVAEPLDALERVLGEEDGDPFSGTVRVAGPAEVMCERVLPALAALVGAGLRVHTSFGMPDELLEAVARGRIDLAVSSVRPRRPGVVAEPLFDEEFVLVAAPSWVAKAPAVVGPDWLRTVPLVAYSPDAPIVRRYWRTVFETRLTRAPDVIAADLRGVLAAVVAGAGASVLPAYLCRSQLDAGLVRPLVEPELPPLNTLYLAHRPAALGRRTVAAVRERIRSAAATW